MDGLLNVNKPTGMTSRDVVNLVQRRIRPLKVGHTGTLDPLASGVLVLTIGKATRLTEYVQKLPKRYVGSFRLGLCSDTEDIEGDVRPFEAPMPTELQIRDVLSQFTGPIMQKPPAYSALKIKGRRAYQLARKGQAVELAPRQVRIDRLELIRFDGSEFSLDITCGGGTYIRSLGRDIARALQTEAVMTALQRTAVGPFSLQSAIDVATVREGDLMAHLLPMVTALSDYHQIEVTSEQKHLLCTGRAIKLPGEADAGEPVVAVDCDQQLIAILQPRGDLWHPIKTFQRPD